MAPPWPPPGSNRWLRRWSSPGAGVPAPPGRQSARHHLDNNHSLSWAWATRPWCRPGPPTSTTSDLPLDQSRQCALNRPARRGRRHGRVWLLRKHVSCSPLLVLPGGASRAPAEAVKSQYGPRYKVHRAALRWTPVNPAPSTVAASRRRAISSLTCTRAGAKPLLTGDDSGRGDASAAREVALDPRARRSARGCVREPWAKLTLVRRFEGVVPTPAPRPTARHRSPTASTAPPRAGRPVLTESPRSNRQPLSTVSQAHQITGGAVKPTVTSRPRNPAWMTPGFDYGTVVKPLHPTRDPSERMPQNSASLPHM